MRMTLFPSCGLISQREPEISKSNIKYSAEDPLKQTDVRLNEF